MRYILKKKKTLGLSKGVIRFQDGGVTCEYIAWFLRTQKSYCASNLVTAVSIISTSDRIFHLVVEGCLVPFIARYCTIISRFK